MLLKRTKNLALSLLAVITVSTAAGAMTIATTSAPPTSTSTDATRPLVMKEVGDQIAKSPPSSSAANAPAATKTLSLYSALTPSTGSAAQNAVGSPTGPFREVFGFGLASSLGDPTVGYSTWNFSILSTVAFFGLHVQTDGTFAGDSGATVWNSTQLSGLVSTAHSHRTKVVLTIILQDFAAGTPSMCAALGHTSATVSQTVAEVKAKGVDGVNVDYEGLDGSCGTSDSSWARRGFTAFVGQLRSALPAGSDLTVDTYASSAAGPIGFFDIPGLAPSVSAFFVMAYDLEYSNYGRAPTSCTSFCLGPTAPLSGYYYNDTTTASQYLSVVPASKVILGVPYYGRKACVGSGTPNAYPTSTVVADTYLDASGEATAPEVRAGSFATHRDANDPTGNERWDAWTNTTLNCTRELYWDDATSLGLKYDLINRDNLRGVGLWNLNYGGGAPELWSLLAAKFATTTSWSSLGGVLTSGPDASSWSPSRTDLFARGTDNGLWQDTWNGSGMTGWVSLGGVLTADPTAVSWGSNRIDVFARGTDNGLWHRAWTGTAWSAWESLGGILTSGPEVASWGAGRLDILVRGTDKGLWHLSWDGQKWSAWQPLGGILTTDPGVVSWGPDRIDVFARGTDNGLWHLGGDGASWSTWQPLGGLLASEPEASSCASGHLDVFALGSDRALYQLGYNGSWGTWQRLGGRWTTDAAAVCPPTTTAVSLFERGSDGALWQTSVPGS